MDGYKYVPDVSGKVGNTRVGSNFESIINIIIHTLREVICYLCNISAYITDIYHCVLVNNTRFDKGNVDQSMSFIRHDLG